MLSGVCVGTNDLKRAGQFYDRVLATIDMQRCFENDIEIGYCSAKNDHMFWVLKPFDGQPASAGNGSQLIFSSDDPESVQAFYAVALEMGGSDEGPPGPRDYRKGYYGAYCRDIDGNKLHVYCIDDGN